MGEESDARRPQGPTPSPEEKIALFDTLLAYVGSCTVEGERVIHKLDGSWNELRTGTTQTRFLSFEDGSLIYLTPETVDPRDGRLCVYRVEFATA